MPISLSALKPPMPGPCPARGSKITKGRAVCTDFDAGRRHDANEAVIDRPVQLAAVDQQLALEFEDVRRGFGGMLAIGIAPLPQHVQEQHPTLRRVGRVFAGGARACPASAKSPFFEPVGADVIAMSPSHRAGANGRRNRLRQPPVSAASILSTTTTARFGGTVLRFRVRLHVPGFPDQIVNGHGPVDTADLVADPVGTQEYRAHNCGRRRSGARYRARPVRHATRAASESPRGR